MEEFEQERQTVVEEDPELFEKYEDSYYLYAIARILDAYTPLPDFYSFQMSLFNDLVSITNNQAHNLYYLARIIPTIKPVSYLLAGATPKRASLSDFVKAELKYIIGQVKVLDQEKEVSPLEFQIRIKRKEYDDQRRIINLGSMLSYHFRPARGPSPPSFVFLISTEKIFITSITLDILSDKMKTAAQKIQEFTPESRIGDLPIRIARALHPKNLPPFR